MKPPVQQGNFRQSAALLLVVFFTVFCLFGTAQADCIGGVGTDNIVISNKATDFYSSGDVVDCITTGSITLGPYVTIPADVVFNLVAPIVSIKTDVEALLGSQLHIFTPKQLNDTGIVGCSDNGANNLECPVLTHPGQDADYGRDVTHNDDSDGHAGFSFTKLDANGSPLPSGATIWSCVKDNVTGLIWEVKTDDGGLRDMDNQYTWYNSDPSTNGGIAGKKDGGYCTGSDCDTQGYVQAVNAQGLCGANDWRMPTIKELENIARLDQYNLAIDTNYFPDTNIVSATYWSATPYAEESSNAWAIFFYYGYTVAHPKYYVPYVRLVRDGE